MKNKRGFEIDYFVAILIGIIVLVVAIGGYIILKNKGINAIDFIKHAIRR